MRRKMIAGLALAALAVSAAAGEFARVEPDVSALPPEQRVVAELLKVRVRERTSGSADGAALRVKYLYDRSIGGDDGFVSLKGDLAEIRAGRFRGLVFATGNLLKALRYGTSSLSVDDGFYDFTPKMPIRIAYTSRHYLNWYMEAPADEICRYLEDLALDGINSFYFQYAYPDVDRARASDEMVAAFLRTSRRMYDRIKSLDCEVGEHGGNNQLPMDAPEKFRGVPNSDPPRCNYGFNACPEKPGALEALMNYRKEGLAALGDVRPDYFLHWPFDEGGCECEKCYPWGGKGYLKLIEKFHALNRAAHPEAKSLVSTWLFHDDDFDGLYEYLGTHDWIDVILCDSHNDFPKYPLMHKIPGKTKIITFPEISMWGRHPWGGYGAIACPERFERLFRQSEPVVSGFMYYSEGIFEDINKAVVTGLYVDPSAKVDDILRRYGAYHFAGTDPADFVRLAHLFEANHELRKMTYPNVTEAKRLADRMDHEILPSLRGSWRWRLVWLRATVDRELLGTWTWGDRPPPEVLPYYDEITRIYHAEEQVKRLKAGFKGCGNTCPKYCRRGQNAAGNAP